jgi:hypothetical protein
LREAVDALPSLVRVALRLAAAPSTEAASHALESLAMVLTCPPFMERAAGGCDAAATAVPSPSVAESLNFNCCMSRYYHQQLAMDAEAGRI